MRLGRLAAISLIATALSTVGACPALAVGSHAAAAPRTTSAKAGTAGVPGDVTGAGLPDVLNNQYVNLTVLPPHGAPYTASASAQSPDGSSWSMYQVSSRGSVTGGAVSDLYAFQTITHTLYAYPNDAQFGGTPGHFTHPDKAIKVAKPATCATGSDCTGYDPTWGSTTQVLATDGVDNTDGMPDLVTVENGKLWYYPGKASTLLGNPVLLGTGYWSNSTIIAPGKVGGTPTLWADEPTTGSIASYPLSFKADGTPTTVFAAPAPVEIQSAVTTTDGIAACLTGRPGPHLENCGWQPGTWLLGADSTIRYKGTCLTLDAATGTLSARTCTGLPSQKWTVGTGGELVSPNALCLTAGDVETTDTVSLTPCTGAANQSWGVPGKQANSPTPLPAPQTVLPQAYDTVFHNIGSYVLGAMSSAGDLNGDGNPELLITGASNQQPQPVVFEYPGTGSTNGLAWFGTPFGLGSLSNPTAVLSYRNGSVDAGQVLYSACASLRMQDGSNLVLSNVATGQQLWSSQSPGRPGSAGFVDANGEFMVQDVGNYTSWSTMTLVSTNTTNSTLTLGDDCNLVLRDNNGVPLWSSRTYDPAHETNGHAFAAGYVLHAGDRTDGATYLTMDQDGTLHLVSTAANRNLWTSGTGGHPGATATLQADGNFVIYAADGTPLWSSQSSGHPGSHITVQNDGNLVGYDADQRPTWSTGTSYTGVDTRGQAIVTGTTLASGTTVESKAGRLVMQADGNLVIYSKATGHPLWSSSTYNNPGAHAVMQADGNLVVYAANGAALWSTNTGNHFNAHAVFQDDDNFVLYDPTGTAVWSSDTANTAALTRGNVLRAGTVLHTGDKPANTPSPFPADLEMQADGNLVLNTFLVWGHPVWAAGTYNNPGAYATMQADGNFVIYAANGHPLWSTNTSGNPGAFLVVQTDGNVVLYDADSRPLWSTNTPYWYYYGH